MKEGVEKAREIIKSGLAKKQLERFIEETTKYMTKQKRIERRKYGNRSTEFVSCRFRSLSGSVKTGISFLMYLESI